MSLKEGLKFQNRLKEKIESYRQTQRYAESKTGKSKITRSLDLLMGTNPEVLERLGIDSIPDDPEKAMNSVRSQDISIVKETEIFDLKGNGKLTGHHGTPASLLRAVGALKPADQDYVFQHLSDIGIKHGLDPDGILALEGRRVHGKIAHGGDWSGRRTGAFLDPIPGESGKDFIKRFSKAYNIQMDQNERAIADSLTQDWQGAMRGAADGLDVPELDINSTTTPASQRKDLTDILKPSADEVRTIVESNAGNPSQIRKETEKIVRGTPINKKRTGLLENLRRTATPSPTNLTPGERFGRKSVLNSMDPLTLAIRGVPEAVKGVNNNRRGATIGGISASLADPEAIASALEGNFKEAGANLAGGVFTGAAIQNTLKVMPAGVQSLAGRATPVLAGAQIFAEGRDGSATHRIVDKAADFTPGLRSDPETDIGKRTGEWLANEGKYWGKQLLKIFNN
jgi:hypothetical protein